VWVLFIGECREQLFPTYPDQREYLLQNVPLLVRILFQRVLCLSSRSRSTTKWQTPNHVGNAGHVTLAAPVSTIQGTWQTHGVGTGIFSCVTRNRNGTQIVPSDRVEESTHSPPPSQSARGVFFAAQTKNRLATNKALAIT
jgi:hypothetical protein